MIRSPNQPLRATRVPALDLVPGGGRRRAGLLIWMLPALAAIVVATFWWVGPNSPEADSPQTPPSTGPHQSGLKAGQPAARGSASLQSGSADRVPDSQGPAKSDVVANPSLPQTMTLEEIQQAVAGEWSGFYQGQRRLSVREGGQATMVVEPEGFAAMLLASKLTFDVQWTVKGDTLEFETIGGDPLDKVNVVVKMYGKRRSHQILDLQRDKIVLLDEDGVTQYVWNRIPADSKTAPPVVAD